MRYARRSRTRLRIVLATLLCAVAFSTSCTHTRTVLVPYGTPVQLRAPAKAKVGVLDKDGIKVAAVETLPAGWWVLPDTR